MTKSFYELDYIIEISEKRLAEYTALYQKVLERFTNIILIYSALGIFLIPLTQHVLATDIPGIIFYIIFTLFFVLLIVSLIYVVRLLLPAGVVYLDPPHKYYAGFKNKLEAIFPDDRQVVDDSLKSSYIIDLEDAIRVNKEIFRQKNFFFYNALVFALLAVVPYVVCLGYHLSKKEEKVQKIELVEGKFSNFISHNSH